MRRNQRSPVKAIVALSLLAVAIAWVLIPLSAGRPVPSPAALLSSLLGSSVLAGDGEGDAAMAAAPAPGKVRVFVSGRQIPAYSKVIRDDLWNPQKGTWAVSDVDSELAESAGILVDVQQIVGRVLASDKQPGYVFTEKDFLPVGTRPGLSAGVPAGKRALRLEVDKVHGIVGLQPGDRFDMVAARALEPIGDGNQPAFVGVYSELAGQRASRGSQSRASVEVLVQSGVVVTPLQTRQVPTTSSTLTAGTTTRTVPVQEMVIALDPEEVSPLLGALELGAELTCLARSGRPDDPLDSMTPSLNSGVAGANGASEGILDDGQEMTVVESIDDQDRVLVPVPAGGPGGS